MCVEIQGSEFKLNVCRDVCRHGVGNDMVVMHWVYVVWLEWKAYLFDYQDEWVDIRGTKEVMEALCSPQDYMNGKRYTL